MPLRAVFMPVPADTDVLATAEAFTASPPWAGMHDAVAVVRTEPQQAWGVLGWLDDADAERVRIASWQIPETLGRLRYIDYGHAEADAGLLASRLRERLGDDVTRYPYHPLPRGGHFVYGMLSYALDLPKHATTRDDPTRPLVLVDDCAISGDRVRRALSDHPGRELIIATLYSHPDLRAAVCALEPYVVDFISARDLDDHAPRQHGDDYDAWVGRWRDRLDDYWIGNPDHVAFAWSEPDMTIWNDVTGQAEVGWRVVSPARCLKNRAAGTPRLQLQVVPRPGEFVIPPDVLFAAIGDATVVASASHRSVAALRHSAVDVWEGLLAGEEEKSIVRGLTGRYAVSQVQAAADVRAVINRLLSGGMLRRA